jgi:hypothetical protein
MNMPWNWALTLEYWTGRKAIHLQTCELWQHCHLPFLGTIPFAELHTRSFIQKNKNLITTASSFVPYFPSDSIQISRSTSTCSWISSQISHDPFIECHLHILVVVITDCAAQGEKHVNPTRWWSSFHGLNLPHHFNRCRILQQHQQQYTSVHSQLTF